MCIYIWHTLANYNVCYISNIIYILYYTILTIYRALRTDAKWTGLDLASTTTNTTSSNNNNSEMLVGCCALGNLYLIPDAQNAFRF